MKLLVVTLLLVAAAGSAAARALASSDDAGMHQATSRSLKQRGGGGPPCRPAPLLQFEYADYAKSKDYRQGKFEKLGGFGFAAYTFPHANNIPPPYNVQPLENGGTYYFELATKGTFGGIIVSACVPSSGSSKLRFSTMVQNMGFAEYSGVPALLPMMSCPTTGFLCRDSGYKYAVHIFDGSADLSLENNLFSSDCPAATCLGTAVSPDEASVLPNKQWVSKEVDMTPYAGKSIQIAFRVASGAYVDQDLYTGWDNIAIVTV